MHSTMVSLRVSTNLLQQIDALQEPFASNAKLAPSGNASRSSIMLHLMLLGLEQLRKEGISPSADVPEEKAAP
jgi:hypothetical protein